MWEVLASGVKVQNKAGAVGHLSPMHMADRTRPQRTGARSYQQRCPCVRHMRVAHSRV